MHDVRCIRHLHLHHGMTALLAGQAAFLDLHATIIPVPPLAYLDPMLIMSFGGKLSVRIIIPPKPLLFAVNITPFRNDLTILMVLTKKAIAYPAAAIFINDTGVSKFQFTGIVKISAIFQSVLMVPLLKSHTQKINYKKYNNEIISLSQGAEQTVFIAQIHGECIKIDIYHKLAKQPCRLIVSHQKSLMCRSQFK